ncbi:MAG: serine/threonine-protein kinase [Gemmatimonadaceae bacterium]
MTHPSAEFLDLQSALAGEYSLQRELGRGGMGVVYLARDVQLDRDVAIKVLPSALAHNLSARERFVREARTAAGLSHPHIVPIHRVGESGGFVFFVMTYVEGETLGERLRSRGPLSAADVTRIMREVAWALAYAHGRGIVHRDVKPDNILLEAGTGRAMVTDFGIAHVGESAGHATDAGNITGTAHFMSPEQFAGEPVDGRSDIYSLGVVGYMAVSGRLPFDAPTLPALMIRQSSEEAPTVGRFAPGLPRALAQAINQCLQRDVALRFTDGEALAAALVPAPDPRPALPPTLRAWLNARNPLLVPYLAWGGLFGSSSLVNLAVWVTGNRPAGFGDIPFLAAIASLPIVPIVGFHLHQARRQFRAGHSLADLRSALQISELERVETDAVAELADDAQPHRRWLQMSTIAAATWLAVTLALLLNGTIHENRNTFIWFAGPVLSTMLLGAVSNALDVQFIPNRIRKWWQTGVRDRLWKSAMGEWLATRLGAPVRSQPVGAGVFRPTEAAIGVAASELFAALPAAYRDQLSELPSILAALEARAVAARADVDVLAALAPLGSRDATAVAERRNGASAQLAQSVAALENLRLDLLRLHAGASNLAPIHTLIDAARVLGDDVGRLADAQDEVEEALKRTN